MKLSLIIPIYNEAKTIEACQENLRNLDGELEIIFADGGSTDGTRDMIAPDFIFLDAPKGRANQMNDAASKATGNVLWFAHADTILPSDGPTQIRSAVSEGAQFGCFHIAFDAPGLLMKINAVMSDFRASFWQIAFGDQAIFLTRDLFERIGGWPDLPIMEDYELSRKIKRDGVSLHLLPGTVRTSARRYAKRPSLLVMFKMFHLRHLYRKGHDIKDIARRYRDIR